MTASPLSPRVLLACLLAVVTTVRVGAASTGLPADVLLLFARPTAQKLGAEEVTTVGNWPRPETVAERPGLGLAQHPMLYAGEGYNVLQLVHGGRVIWTYQCGRGGEIDDVWLMSNGHILFTRQHSIEEVTADKTVVWH